MVLTSFSYQLGASTTLIISQTRKARLKEFTELVQERLRLREPEGRVPSWNVTSIFLSQCHLVYQSPLHSTKENCPKFSTAWPGVQSDLLQGSALLFNCDLKSQMYLPWKKRIFKMDQKKNALCLDLRMTQYAPPAYTQVLQKTLSEVPGPKAQTVAPGADSSHQLSNITGQGVA